MSESNSMKGFALFALAQAEQHCRCLPGQTCWPSDAEWQKLNVSIGGRLELPTKPSFKLSCAGEAAGGDPQQCIDDVSGYMDNDFVPPTFSASVESTGLGVSKGGWQNLPSTYVVAAERPGDVSQAVAFASKHDLRLVVKGAGHDYLGRSVAPDSLLVWTHRMDSIDWATDGSSVKVGAGVHWEDVYNQAQQKGRYVLGGGCPTVGAAGGFVMGAGYNEFLSRQHGTVAHNVLAFTVVLSDGSIVQADETQNQDLFWALRGGGGGTFGVVIDVTYRTHDFPKQYGYVSGTVHCYGDASSKRAMLAEFFSFANSSLLNENWGSMVTWTATGELSVSMGYNDIPYLHALATWKPFSKALDKFGCKWRWAAGVPIDYPEPFVLPMKSITVEDQSIAKLYPTPTGKLIKDDPKGRWVDTATINEMNAYWIGYASRYISMDLFSQPQVLAAKLDELVQTEGSPESFQVFFGKALGGKVNFDTSVDLPVNPAVYTSGALLITAAALQNNFPDLPQTWETLQLFEKAARSFFTAHGVDKGCFSKKLFGDDKVQECWTTVTAAVDGYVESFNTVYTAKMRELFGDASYANEGDFFEQGWQESFWGSNYPRLKAIKDAVDPQGLFVCHHCVGSEEWTEDGNCRLDGSAVTV